MFHEKELKGALRAEGGITRRLMLAYAGSLASIPLLSRASESTTSRPRFTSDPFTLGVASGDPDHDSVVLWTKLAPKPTEPGGGISPEPIDVQWELADDEAMKNIIRKGIATATAPLGHSVHVVARGLEPDRWYYYRFRAGDAVSPVGRTRTMPALDSSSESLRFAFASCQHYESGYYHAYEDMAKHDLDLVFHLGDYIYEGRGKKSIREHLGDEIMSLDDYRIRHAQYRSDPLLHGMHARCPWVVTWDDHEFDNNCASDISEEKGVSPFDFLQRRANAYQAYYEAMPLRPRSLPRGPSLQLYRKVTFGLLAEFLVLDTRQYRSDQPHDDKPGPLAGGAIAPSQSILGRKQRGWLQGSLIESTSTWNVLAQQVMMGMVGFKKEDQPLVYSMDQWPGYTRERMELLRFMQERRVRNPVVLTGDIHSNWVNDLRVDDRKTDEPVVATEFVGTSISSGGKGVERTVYYDGIMANNPGVRFHDALRGYVKCTVTPTTWTSDYMVAEDVTSATGKVVKGNTFVVEAGQPGAKKA